MSKGLHDGGGGCGSTHAHMQLILGGELKPQEIFLWGAIKDMNQSFRKMPTLPKPLIALLNIIGFLVHVL